MAPGNEPANVSRQCKCWWTNGYHLHLLALEAAGVDPFLPVLPKKSDCFGSGQSLCKKMAPGQKQRGGEVECEESFALAGGRGQGVASLGDQQDGWRATWKATFGLFSSAFFASIDSPDGREARGSAGAAVQPIKFAQFR